MLYPTFTPYRDPFALMRTMLRDFDRADRPEAQARVFPAVNLWQGDEALAITAELPGVDPSDINVSVSGTVLTLSGERRAPDVPEEAAWHRRERGFGKFSREIRLPFEADDGKVEARFQNGVLRIVVGLPDAEKPRKIKIKAA